MAPGGFAMSPRSTVLRWDAACAWENRPDIPLSRKPARQADCLWAIEYGVSPVYRDEAPAFFLSAHRNFASADNFFRAAALIGFRVGTFFPEAAVFFGADVPFRAAVLIVRLRCVVFGGRPRRGSAPSRAAIA